MARYRLLEGARGTDNITVLDDPGYEFDWDGVTIDSDGDIRYTNSKERTDWVDPKFVEPVSDSQFLITASTKTVEVEVKELTFTVSAEVAQDLVNLATTSFKIAQQSATKELINAIKEVLV